MSQEEYKNQTEELWVKLETYINRIIASSSSSSGDDGSSSLVNIQKYEYDSEDDALTSLGKGIFDSGQLSSREKRLKKLKASKKEEDNATTTTTTTTISNNSVSVGHLSFNNDENNETLVLALVHGTNLLSSLSQLGTIKILRSDPKSESSITCTKKKCEVVIKFCVMPPPSSGGNNNIVSAEEAPSSLTAINLNKCMSKDVRSREGLDYQLYRQEMAMAALSTTTSSLPTTVNNGDDVKEGDSKQNDEMIVTAFEVSGSIDYNKLIEKFGSRPLTPYLLRRLENVTVKRGTVPKLHRFLRREIFFSHRDIERICELLEGWYGVNPPPIDEEVEEEASSHSPPLPTTPCPIYLYTGRGPSSAAMHLGHLVPFLFTAWLQKAFQCPLVIQMTDDEKFLFKGEYDGNNAGDGGDDDNNNRTGDNLDEFAKLTIENAKDIIACDFIPEKTFLFSDLDYVGTMYPNIVRIWKAVTTNQVNGIFGFDGTSNIGKVAFPAIQAAPSFGSSFPKVLGGGESNAATLACLIPCAIDQDPYFRLTRDVAHKLVPKHHPLKGKPALIHSKFFPPLQGAQVSTYPFATNFC